MDSSKCECTWYKRDVSIVAGSADYDKVAGFGWKKIDADFNTLTLDGSDVPYKTKYKLITVYNSSATLSAEIEVTNLTSFYSYELV
jgi:hypothetical protein